MASGHLKLGSMGEQAARAFLKKKGYRILERNWRCVRGEIDLICSRKGTLVFVEVKTRSEDGLVHPRDLLIPQKQARMTAAAKLYLTRTKGWNRPCRFDLVTVVWKDSGDPTIEHVRDAFAIGGSSGCLNSPWQPW
ncbi:MAG: YraN family protein [Desulfovibrionales bacterium]